MPAAKDARKATPPVPAASKVNPAIPAASLPAAAKPAQNIADPSRPAGLVSEAANGSKGDTAFVFIVDQDLRSFLQDFARRYGLRADIASGIRGKLSQVKLPSQPRDLLRELATRYEIEWTFEGDVLKVTSRSEMGTRILPLGNVAFNDWIAELNSAGIDTSRYTPIPMQGSKAAIMTAPVTYLSRAAAILEVLKTGQEASSELRIIRAGVSQKVQFD